MIGAPPRPPNGTIGLVPTPNANLAHPMPGLQPRDIHDRIRELIGSPSDHDLLTALQPLASSPWFTSFCYLYGPHLYLRSPHASRRFLLDHLDADSRGPDLRAYDPWRGPESSDLLAWLKAADDADDAEVFAFLHAWRSRTLPDEQRVSRWRAEVLDRFSTASGENQRELALAKLTCDLPLDETTAFALFKADSTIATPFIRQHLPSASPQPGYWSGLSSAARQRGDSVLFFELYRRTVENEQWARDVELLADRIESADALVAQLELRHPDHARDNGSSVLYTLLRKRGRDVLPYASHVVRRWESKLSAEPARLGDLIRLADDNGWLGLWTGLIWAAARDTELDHEVRRLVDDRRRDDDMLCDRLRVLAASGLERRARRHIVLSDGTATKLYERYPDAMRHLYRRFLRVGPAGYAKLAAVVALARDDAMIDWLAALICCVDYKAEWARREVSPMIDVLLPSFEALRETPGQLAERTARVLSMLPEKALPRTGFRGLIAGNRLAELILDRENQSLLSSPSAMRSLLGASEPHCRRVGYALLTGQSSECSIRAIENADLLRAALFERMPRRVRRTAIAAIDNAARDADFASSLLPAIRDALQIADRGYPRDDLIALLGRLSHRHPQLTTRGESTGDLQ